MKGKVNQAMKHGVPVVATSMAIEGMHLHNGTECLVGEWSASDSLLGSSLTGRIHAECMETVFACLQINQTLEGAYSCAFPAPPRLVIDLPHSAEGRRRCHQTHRRSFI